MNFVKYLMVTLFILVLAVFSMAAVTSSDFNFDIRVFNDNAILCEPLMVDVKITYNGNEPLEGYLYENDLYVNDNKIEENICKMTVHIDKGFAPKYTFKPGKAIYFRDNLRCYYPFWKPGKYDVQVKTKINQELIISTPPFRITISEPAGIDKKVFDIGKANYSPDAKFCIRGGLGICRKDLWNPCTYSEEPDESLLNISSEEIALKYPASRYTVWLYYIYMFDPIRKDPRQIAISISKGKRYPDGNSVWDPTVNGHIRDLSDTKKYAKWAKEKSLEMIKLIPNFPDKERLIVVAGICSIVLGEELEGIEILKKLIQESNSREAIWAKQFLEEWMKQKNKIVR